ncbi:MAG: carotenoid 1,2-hydratase, partial [Rubrivivax sp.]
MTISNVPRRQWLAAALLAAGVSPWARAGEPLGVRRGRTLVFPRDHGAHPETNIEWWYLTGFLGDWDRPQAGFQ